MHGRRIGSRQSGGGGGSGSGGDRSHSNSDARSNVGVRSSTGPPRTLVGDDDDDTEMPLATTTDGELPWWADVLDPADTFMLPPPDQLAFGLPVGDMHLFADGVLMQLADGAAAMDHEATAVPDTDRTAPSDVPSRSGSHTGSATPSSSPRVASGRARDVLNGTDAGAGAGTGAGGGAGAATSIGEAQAWGPASVAYRRTDGVLLSYAAAVVAACTDGPNGALASR